MGASRPTAPASAVAKVGGFEIEWRPVTGLPIEGLAAKDCFSWKDRVVRGVIPPPPAQSSKKKDKQEIEDYVTVEPLASQFKDARPRRTLITSKEWANMPAPTITPELKKDLELLRLRTVVDPKRHYKAPDSKKLPERFQIGRVIEGPADFYSARLTKREQKSSFADELLSDPSLKTFRKRKYDQIQSQKQAGGKKFAKQKQNRRRKSWAKT
eukprot:TRINITY_DN10878_c0_g1_i1.p1 TRINITY_DN10878_c0_g1~~TRINITY_DN10878_c0_g1_i1.p1  ORF type:complete len:212 (-),score=33.88 TRINITY_DN10878_c0_g1_i1:591-1226(-)